MIKPSSPALDFKRLFKLRLIVARHGEMDNARWWNTNKLLGTMGSAALKRGFPLTHHFAQARAVFEVAAARSKEVFSPPPGMVTLWDLSASVEDEFTDQYQAVLDDRDAWTPFFEAVQLISGTDLLSSMERFTLIDGSVTEAIRSLRRSNENRAVALPGEQSLDNNLITMLAAAFALSEPGAPAIPYAKLRKEL